MVTLRLFDTATREHRDFVPVRPNQSGTVGAFARTGLCQFHGQILFDIRLVLEPKIFGGLRNPAVRQTGKG